MKIPRIIPISAVLVIGMFLTSCTGGQITSNWPGLTADQDYAYLANGPEVYAVRINDGTLAWRYPEKPDAKRAFYASPAVTQDGQVLVAGFDNVLYSLKAENGQENWSYRGAKDRLVASPVATDQSIYLPSADSLLYSLDMNGTEKWKFDTGHALWSSPLVNSEDVIFGSMDHSLYSVNAATGQRIWETDLGASIVGSPVLSEEGTIYIGTVAKEMVAVEAESGSILWRVPTDGGVWTTPIMQEGTLYFGDLTGNFYAMDPANGQVRWKIQPDGPIVGTPVITENRLVFGTEVGSLVAVDFNGTVIWNKPIGGKLYTSPVLAGDRILVAPLGAEDKMLVALDQNGNQVWTFVPPK